MKRLFAAILALLLLTGCAQAEPEETTGQTESRETTAPVETLPGIYDSGDALEQLTDGAVRAFALEENCIGIRMLGSDVLAFYAREDQTCLVLYGGKDLYEKARIQLPCVLDPASSMVQVNETGVAYCCLKENLVIQLDSQLRQVSRIDLPEDMEGEPVLSPDLNFLYYCAPRQIRALDLRGLYSRLLKDHDMPQQKLLQCSMGGDVLLWDVSDAEGDSYICFVSAETGETLGRTSALYSFDSSKDLYVLQRSEGSICEIIFGAGEGEPSSLFIGSGTQRVRAVPESCIALTVNEKEEGIRLDAYDLTSGTKAASVMLEGQHQLVSVLGDGADLWVLTEQKLLLWDMSASPVEENGVYIGKYHTSQSPDTEALKVCQTDAQILGDTYGVDIRVWKDALANSGEYILEEEYQPQAVKNGMRALEDALRRYPEGFLAELGGNTVSGKIHISLVRSISGDFTGTQFWENGDAYIVIAIGSETESAFHRELSHVLDTYIFGRSREYDDWESVNPAGFAYDLSYDLYVQRAESPWLGEGEWAFINSLSMTYPNEDRATVFEYAMGSGNETYFATETMQIKLQKICDAIREAFAWEDATEVLPWEQYLIPAEE